MTRQPHISPASLLSHARRRLAGEQGIAMVIAITVMMVLLALVGGAVAVSTQSSSATTRDDNVKAADEAAEAGLRVATYRLNQIQPSDGNCINNNAAVAPASDGTCHDATESLGNGVTFTYYTTPALGTGSSCVGYAISSSILVSQRCVTAVGTSNGVTRRAQIRIASYAGAPLFPASGLVGLEGISINNQANINGSATSNGTISLNNQATIVNNGSNAVLLGPSGNVTEANQASYPMPALQRTAQQGPYTLSPVDPGNSATANDDYRITNGIANPPASPYDASTKCTMGRVKGACWNPTDRTLTINNQQTVTLGGGIYNFCSLSVNNQGVLTIANGAHVAIFIDSGARAGSGCPAAPTQIVNGGRNANGGLAGFFDVDNQGQIINPSLDPTALVVYVYDNTGAAQNSDGMLHENNQGVLYGTIYAPLVSYHLDNQAGVVGGVAADRLTIDNQFHYTWDSRDASLQARTSGVYYRTAWRECQPSAPNINDPQSGC
jgi:Tfp pilus assembly protein PilX